jgi:hypothetical protein
MYGIVVKLRNFGYGPERRSGDKTNGSPYQVKPATQPSSSQIGQYKEVNFIKSRTPANPDLEFT